jgi:orotate phosphoribosyltransferase
LTKDELGKQIYNTSHITGEFLLRSGQTSNEYFDKYLFESNPKLLKEIATHISETLPADTEILAGLETGGIPIATMISQLTNHPTIFVRKEAKTYGTCKLAEGTDFKGKKITVIEDVVTTGGQIIKSVTQLRELGANIDKVMCVILRDPKAYDILGEAGLQLTPLFTMAELKFLVGE